MDLYGPSKLVFEPLSHWAVTAGLHPIPGSPSRGSCPPRCCRKWCPCPWSRCRCQWNRWLGSDRDSSAENAEEYGVCPRVTWVSPIDKDSWDILWYIFLCSSGFLMAPPRDAGTHVLPPIFVEPTPLKKKKTSKAGCSSSKNSGLAICLQEMRTAARAWDLGRKFSLVFHVFQRGSTPFRGATFWPTTLGWLKKTLPSCCPKMTPQLF